MNKVKAQQYGIDLGKLLKDNIVVKENKTEYALNSESELAEKYISYLNPYSNINEGVNYYYFSSNQANSSSIKLERRRLYEKQFRYPKDKIDDLIIALCFYNKKYISKLTKGDWLYIYDHLSYFVPLDLKYQNEDSKALLEFKNILDKKLNQIKLFYGHHTKGKLEVKNPLVVQMIQEALINYFRDKNIVVANLNKHPQNLIDYVKAIKKFIKNEFENIRELNLLIADLLITDNLLPLLSNYANKQNNKEHNREGVYTSSLFYSKGNIGIEETEKGKFQKKDYIGWKEFCRRFIENYSN